MRVYADAALPLPSPGGFTASLALFIFAGALLYGLVIAGIVSIAVGVSRKKRGLQTGRGSRKKTILAVVAAVVLMLIAFAGGMAMLIMSFSRSRPRPYRPPYDPGQETDLPGAGQSGGTDAPETEEQQTANGTDHPDESGEGETALIDPAAPGTMDEVLKEKVLALYEPVILARAGGALGDGGAEVPTEGVPEDAPDFEAYPDGGFTFFYLDFDEVPELAISQGGAHAAAVEVYSIHYDRDFWSEGGGYYSEEASSGALEEAFPMEVVYLGNYGSYGGTMYLPMQGRIISHYMGMGAYWLAFFQAQVDPETFAITMSKLIELENTEGMHENPEDASYTINGNPVNKTSYDSMMEAMPLDDYHALDVNEMRLFYTDVTTANLAEVMKSEYDALRERREAGEFD